MNKTYACGSAMRRDLVRSDPHARLNGIDYLEVLDRDAPAGAPKQQTLLVHCIRDLPPDLAVTARIEGGVRTTAVRVLWAYPAMALGPLQAGGQITQAELTYYQDSARNPERLLVVRTNTPGDTSRYTLALYGADAATLPDRFDPRLSQVEFSFAVEQEAGFDCRASGSPGCTETATEPRLDYLAKDYSSFRQLMLDRMSVLMPDWRERNPADMGVMLVEVLAYAADQLSYYQDAVATEAYLNTARKRVSVRRHARLLDYPMHDGLNARVWLALQVQGGGEVLLPRRSAATGLPVRFLTRCAQTVTVAESDLEPLLADHHPEVFEPLYDAALYEAHNTMGLYTWGETEFWLARGATRATLRDDPQNPLRLCAGDVLILEEARSPETGSVHDANPAHRHAVRLTRVSPEGVRTGSGDRRNPPPAATALSDPLTGQQVVEIEWAEADALPFSFCVRTVIGGQSVEVGIARGNVLLADHGMTTREMLPAVPDQGRYAPQLTAGPISCREPVQTGRLRALPASDQIRQDPRKALPAMVLRSPDPNAPAPEWQPARDLLSASRFDQAFVAETETGGITTLRFGDELLGKRPNSATRLEAEYRIGNGPAGNVAAGSIRHVVTADSGIVAVTNPLPARGGMAPESLDEVRLYAPVAFRKQERAVTEADYAEAAMRHSEVRAAVATLRWTGSWHTLFVTVEHRRGALPVREFDAFRASVRQHLARFRLAGHDLEVDAPRYVPLDIAFTVQVSPGYFKADVKQALLEAFSSRPLPDGQTGFFHPDRFTFGQTVYLSQIVAAAMQVPGVAWIDTSPAPAHRFRRWGQAPAGELERGQIEMGRLEVARLENDPNWPENGRIHFDMGGGL